MLKIIKFDNEYNVKFKKIKKNNFGLISVKYAYPIENRSLGLLNNV